MPLQQFRRNICDGSKDQIGVEPVEHTEQECELYRATPQIGCFLSPLPLGEGIKKRQLYGVAEYASPNGEETVLGTPLPLASTTARIVPSSVFFANQWATRNY